MFKEPIKIQVEGLDRHDNKPEWTVLERFTGRLFRRDVASAFESHKPHLERDGQVLLYGSTVVQLHPDRPTQGYPYPRRPRDIDIAIINSSKEPITDEDSGSSGLTPKLVDYLTDVVESVGGRVINIGDKLGQGVGSAVIQKTYSPQVIARRIEGKNEASSVGEIAPTTVDLVVSIFEPRTPILPVVPRGHIFHEDIREVLSYKIARLITDSTMELKDVADLYNVFSTGVVDFTKDREVIRLVSLIGIASAYHVSPINYQNYLKRQNTQVDNQDDVWRQLTAPISAFIKGISAQDATSVNTPTWENISSCRISPENIALLQKALFVRADEAQQMFEVINQILGTVYPFEGNVTPREDYGGAPLSDDEFSFCCAVDGFASSRQRHRLGVHIDSKTLLRGYPALQSQFPGISERIENNFFLNRKLELRTSWMAM